MPKFSANSTKRLATCHPKLQQLFNEVIKEADCSVLCGFRNKREQEEAFTSGNSMLNWPKSKHNQVPSLAVDVIPYPIDWRDTPRFIEFAELVKKKAKELGIRIRCGADFPKFKDYPHYELTGVD